MKKFLVTVSISRARGFQTWSVEATDSLSAIKKVKGGEGEFYNQEVEVTDLDFGDAIVDEVK